MQYLHIDVRRATARPQEHLNRKSTGIEGPTERESFHSFRQRPSPLPLLAPSVRAQHLLPLLTQRLRPRPPTSSHPCGCPLVTSPLDTAFLLKHLYFINTIYGASACAQVSET